MKPTLPLLLALTGITHGAPGFPEPDVIFYGTATNTNGGQQSYLGELAWTISPASGDPFTVTSELESLAGGIFSYRLRIPAEKVPATFSNTTEKIEAAPTLQTYTMSATINGEAVAMFVGGTATAHDTQLEYEEIARGVIERIDLSFSGIDPGTIDSDGDGMPDFWEDLYSLNKNDPSDAFGDLDEDGLPNLAEYFDDSDPSCYEWSRWVGATGLSSLGPVLGGEDGDPDLDGIPNLLEYALGGDPRSADAKSVTAKVQLNVESDSGGDYLTLTVNRPASRHCNASYYVEISENLDNWNSAEGADIQTLLNDATLLKVRDPSYLDNPAERHKFMRLAIAYTP